MTLVMTTVEKFVVEGFRAISNRVAIEPRRINIIVGRNNVGKSSLIEGLALLLAAGNGYRDVLGRDVLAELLISEKGYSDLRYLINQPERNRRAVLECLAGGRRLRLEMYLDRDGTTLPSEVSSELQRYIYGKISERLRDLGMSIENSLKRMGELALHYGKEVEGIALLLRHMEGLVKFLLSKPATLDELSGLVESFEQDILGRPYGFALSELFKTYSRVLLKLVFELPEMWLRREKIVLAFYDGGGISDLKVVFGEGLRIEPEFGALKRGLDFEQIVARMPIRLLIDEIGSKLSYMERPGRLITVKRGREVPEIPLIYLSHRGMWRPEGLRALISEAFRRKKDSIVDALARDLGIDRIAVMEAGEEERVDIWVRFRDFKEPLPLYTLGDGMVSLLKIIHALAIAEGGVVMIEEPETSLHPGYMRWCSSLIINAATKVQVFLTTHSLEIIEYILGRAEESGVLDSVRLVRMSRVGGILDIVELDGREALARLKAVEQDLRGV